MHLNTLSVKATPVYLQLFYLRSTLLKVKIYSYFFSLFIRIKYKDVESLSKAVMQPEIIVGGGVKTCFVLQISAVSDFRGVCKVSACPLVSVL